MMILHEMLDSIGASLPAFLGWRTRRGIRRSDLPSAVMRLSGIDVEVEALRGKGFRALKGVPGRLSDAGWTRLARPSARARIHV